MRLLSLVNTLILCIVVGCGGHSEVDRSREAVLRVLQSDRDLSQRRNAGLSPDAGPSQVAVAIGGYCDDMDRIDMSACPADFRVAFRQHIAAWREFQGVIKQVPDGFLAGVLTGALNSVLGESDGGTGRLRGELQNAHSEIKSTYQEVEKIGAKYGAAL